RRFAPTAVQFSPEQVSSLHWNHCPVLPESALLAYFKNVLSFMMPDISTMLIYQQANSPTKYLSLC
ncbi:MAG: hypothetical protein ABW084_11460, partial [Candidatus Thiodiazotropha sp.]